MAHTESNKNTQSQRKHLRMNDVLECHRQNAMGSIRKYTVKNACRIFSVSYERVMCVRMSRECEWS